jgi:phage antirepressor YoqD-like protein
MNQEKNLILKKLLNELTIEELKNNFIEKVVEVKELKIKINEMQPKIDFYDAIAGSEDLIEMSSVAKILNFKWIGRNRLFEFLRGKEILRHNNEPYQKYVDRGYFKIIEQVFDNNYGDSMINRKTMVYQKGMDFIRKLLIEANYEYNG